MMVTTVTETAVLTTERARYWLQRWDRQQESYLTDREERFAVIADVVEAAAGRPDPLVVDLGVGPGSLAVRLLERMPLARVVGIDADPLLLGLARAGNAGRRGLRLVDHDLREPGWVDALALERAPDAFVSTTALHWLTREQLVAVYAECASVLRPGGLLVNGDQLGEGAARPRLDALTRVVGRRRAVCAADVEDWTAWWRAVQDAPELAELVAARGPDGVAHHVEDVPTVHDHVSALRAAGFVEAGTVWQHGDDRVLVAAARGVPAGRRERAPAA
jgi:SAM-dependent methyltransferase